MSRETGPRACEIFHEAPRACALLHKLLSELDSDVGECLLRGVALFVLILDMVNVGIVPFVPGNAGVKLRLVAVEQDTQDIDEGQVSAGADELSVDVHDSLYPPCVTLSRAKP